MTVMSVRTRSQRSLKLSTTSFMGCRSMRFTSELRPEVWQHTSAAAASPSPCATNFFALATYAAGRGVQREEEEEEQRETPTEPLSLSSMSCTST